MNLNITSLKRAILFIVAEWGGQSQWAYGQLSNFLQQRGVPSEHLVCIDVDREPDIYGVPEFAEKIHGNGEAAVVRDGHIVFITTLGKDQGKIARAVRRIVKGLCGLNLPVGFRDRIGFPSHFEAVINDRRYQHGWRSEYFGFLRRRFLIRIGEACSSHPLRYLSNHD